MSILRGSSIPVDAVVYTNILTLAVFLLFRILYIWQGVDFMKRNAGTTRFAGGAAAILVGLLTLTILFTMGPTHTWQDINHAGAFSLSMVGIGLSSLSLGTGLTSGRHISKVYGTLAGSRKNVFKV